MRQIEPNPVLAAKTVEIAREAGAAIMRTYSWMQRQGEGGEGVLLDPKADGSPLTRADLQAHRIISARLAAFTPEVPVVSEEDDQSMAYRLPIGDFWMIDPLDGTKEFLARNGEFTVNIALVRDGRAIFGVVVAPALAQAYWGGVGLGAFREIGQRIEPIRVSPPASSNRPRRVVASKSHMNAETVEFIAQLGACELVQAGSSLKFCRVAEGTADVYPRLGPTSEWDTAAAQAIVEAAGGQVSTLDGVPLHYGKPGVLNPHFVASNTPLAELLRR